MTENIKLVLLNHGELFLGRETVIPLNYNLNDIRDIASRGGEYSKTIKVYGTARNNEILGPVFDVNSQHLTFNPQVREPVVLSRDGETVFEGIFQMRKISKQYTSNTDSILVYDVILKSNNSALYNTINERFLTDLNLSRYDRIHDKDGIVENMRSGTYRDGVQYYLGDTPTVEFPVGSLLELHPYEPQDLRPAVYIKALLDRIFEDAGFTYDFPELFELDIDKLVITTNRDSVAPGLVGGLFRAGITTGASYDTALWRYPNVDYQGAPGLPAGRVPASGGQPSYLQVVWPISYNNNIVFDTDNDPNLSLYDQNGNYDNVVGEYVLEDGENVMFFESTFIISTWLRHRVTWPSSTGLSPNQPVYGAYVRFDSTNDYVFPDGWNWSTGGFTIGLPTGRGDFGVYWKNNTDSTNVREQIKVAIVAYDANDVFVGVVAVNTVGENEYTMEQRWNQINEKIFTNEFIANISGIFLRAQFPTAKKIRVVVTSEFENSEPTDGFWGFFQGGSGWLNQNEVGNPNTWVSNLPKSTLNSEFGVEVFRTIPIGYFKNDVADDLYEGALLSVRNLVPTEFRQSDVLTGLIRMYNLYIVDDPIKDKNVIIRTRDRFYADGLELNWNDKVDIRSIRTELLSNTQPKIQYFSHKEDQDDTILKAYKDFSGLNFGELKFTFFNQFLLNQDRLDTPWSPAVLTWRYKKNIPLIPTQRKSETKIMAVGQVYTDDKYFDYRIVGLAMGGPVLLTEGQNVWRHVGHLYPNSFEPKLDINFSLNDFYSHNYSTLTNNNLFNRHYRTQYDILEKGYMMTANFKLNYLDVRNLVMNERIFVNNHWWNINRIIDYNVAGDGLTTVELITADKSIGDFVPNHNVFVRKRLLNNEINTFGQINSGKSNKMSGSENTVVNGKSNKISDTKNTNIIGNYNDIRATNSFVVGSGNKVEGQGIIVLGGNNKTYIGRNKVYVNGLVESFDLVDAGTDNVLDPFNDVSWVLLDAGTDNVLGIGSSTNVHIVDGGTDEV